MVGSISELGGSYPPLNQVLNQGLQALGGTQQIVFTKYTKFVLPLDGFVFWISAAAVGTSSGFARSLFGAPLFNQSPTVGGADTFTVSGSIHWAVTQQQGEDETLAVNQLIFTTSTQVQDFRDIGPTTLWLGTYDGMRFAFNEQGRYFPATGLWHYTGNALYPALVSQIIDDPSTFDASSLVISNSLPAWMSMNLFPEVFSYQPRPAVQLYPSYAVPDNIPAPYAVVHIDPELTRPLQEFPSYDQFSTHEQLMTDTAKVICYGLRNDQALDLMDYVLQYSLVTDNIGVMHCSGVRDEKRTQSELNIIAMKKCIEFRISYYQSRVNQLARQLITSAVPTFNFV